MSKELIKSQIDGITCYGITYSDILSVLQDLIKEENERKIKNIYIIDLEGDILFEGDKEQCEQFILKSKLKNKRNVKEYGLTTPTEKNLVLFYSDEFSHLF
jgi:hypothetical protein